MDGVSKVSIIASVSVLVIATFIAFQFSSVGAQEDKSGLEVSFDEYPSLDHVCFVIEASNSADAASSFPPMFILNETSIDTEKATSKLYIEREYMSIVTSCNACEAEYCFEANGTDEARCENQLVTDCEKCGSTESSVAETSWEDLVLQSTETKGTAKSPGAELKNTFDGVSIASGKKERYKLCYHFNEIPINPSTGKPGSYGTMYLDAKGKLYYDFGNCSFWNVSYGYGRDIVGLCDGCNASVTLPVLVNDTVFYINGNPQYVWCNLTVTNSSSTIGHLYYDDENHYFCHNSTDYGVVAMDVDEGDEVDDQNPYGPGILAVWHLNWTDDSSGNGYTFTYNNSVNRQYEGCKIGHCMKFNGNSNLQTAASITSPKKGTVMLWVNDTSGGGESYWMDSHGGIPASWNNIAWYLGHDSNYIEGCVSTGTGGAYTGCGLGNFSYNTWHHVAFVWDETNSRTEIYLDGISCKQNTLAGNVYSMSKPVYLGKRYDDERYANGYIDDARYYGRALGDDEVRAIYENTAGSYNFAVLGEEEGNDEASETQGRNAIVDGIREQLSEEDAPIVTNQKIYVRYANWSKEGGTFDKAVTYGNQTWAFNYLTGGSDNPYSGTHNVTAIFYAWEKSNMLAGSIQVAVAGLIELTKAP